MWLCSFWRIHERQRDRDGGRDRGTDTQTDGGTEGTDGRMDTAPFLSAGVMVVVADWIKSCNVLHRFAHVCFFCSVSTVLGPCCSVLACSFPQRGWFYMLQMPEPAVCWFCHLPKQNLVQQYLHMFALVLWLMALPVRCSKADPGKNGELAAARSSGKQKNNGRRLGGCCFIHLALVSNRSWLSMSSSSAVRCLAESVKNMNPARCCMFSPVPTGGSV